MKRKSNPNDFQKFLDKVYHFLSFRPRSEKEIIDYLKKKKISLKISSKIVEKLKKQKLIDDQAFALWWLAQRANFRPKGKIALRIELRRKGVAREIVDQVLEKVDEVLLAKKALRKKFASYQKASAFLARRGFSWPTIKKILDSENFKNHNKNNG